MAREELPKRLLLLLTHIRLLDHDLCYTELQAWQSSAQSTLCYLVIVPYGSGWLWCGTLSVLRCPTRMHVTNVFPSSDLLALAS